MQLYLYFWKAQNSISSLKTTGFNAFFFMPILTLTTDLGTQDHYVAALKGTILSLKPDVNIVDISHHIPVFDFYKAAYIVKNSFHYYPPKTVHLIGVTPHSADAHSYLAIEYKNQFFIAADNGVFSAIFDETPTTIVRINGKENSSAKSFSLLELPVNTAIELLKGKDIKSLGEAVSEYHERSFFKAYTTPNSIIGYVVHVDRFQNLITDIHKDLFSKVGNNRKFFIDLKSYNSSSIHKHYDGVIEGELVLLFNSQGFLELAMNQANAAGLLHFNQNDQIKIDFHDN